MSSDLVANNPLNQSVHYAASCQVSATALRALLSNQTEAHHHPITPGYYPQAVTLNLR